MSHGIDRREFLKLSVATGALLAAGEGTIGSPMAQGAPAVTEVDKVTVWVVTDNYYDTLRPDGKNSRRYRVTPVVPGKPKSMHAEHGVAFYVETVVGGKASACMFDYGLDARGVMSNMELLGLDIGKASAFGLSHGHFDHWTCAVPILRQYRSRIATGAPFYVGEEAFAHRYTLRPWGTEPDDLGQLNKEDIDALDLKVVEVKNPVEIIPGAYLTGPIERVTAYEKVPPTFLIQRGNKREPDDFRGEQGLFFNVRGKGLVVLTGCGHAGVVNTVKQAQKIAATEKVHAVMGGFHLVNAKPELIQNTVADIKAMRPDYIVPAHCTGFEAMVAFSRELPEAFTVNTAGTQYTFAA